MKFTHITDAEREEIVLYAPKGHPLAERICELLDEEATVIGQRNTSVFRLSARDIDAFTVRGGTVYAVKADGEYALRERLYRLEERFPDFIRINQSTLVRRGAIKRFDTSFGGALRVTLSSGFSDYISRRQITAVKKGLGLK